MASTKVIGVLGFPVEHSQSPEIFTTFFRQETVLNWSYRKFSYPKLSDFLDLLQSEADIKGFNVTIPHKETILSYLHEIDAKALKIGAVNTVTVTRNANGTLHLKGFNTDYYGFKISLETLPKKPENAIVLGSGGASKAVCAVLKDANIPFAQVSRNPQSQALISYTQLKEFWNHPNPVLINTTPVGMLGFPQKELPLDFSSFPETLQVIDLVYTPAQTPLLKVCEEKGLSCMNGALMLQKQAEMAWEIFKNNE
jgi:shikimate dehydrogenase